MATLLNPDLWQARIILIAISPWFAAGAFLKVAFINAHHKNPHGQIRKRNKRAEESPQKL